MIKSLKISFVIIGTVIGAGFISGREICEFFSGYDAVLTSILVFIAFFTALSFLSASKFLEKSKIFVIVEPLLYFGNFIVLTGMLSALDAMTKNVFPLAKNVPILSVPTLIFSNLVLKRGTGGLKTVNAVLVPVMLLALVVCVFIPNGPTIAFTGKVSPKSCVSYVGMNVFLAIPLLTEIGRCESKTPLVLAALISSVVLSVTIFLILSTVFGQPRYIVNADMPIIELLKSNAVSYYVFTVITYFGILTTLLSAHYPLYKICGNTHFGTVGKILISVSAFIASRFGFYNVVSVAYPIIGVLGTFIIIFIAISATFFRLRQRRDTSALQAGTK